jgi:hypothetical protein
MYQFPSAGTIEVTRTDVDATSRRTRKLVESRDGPVLPGSVCAQIDHHVIYKAPTPALRRVVSLNHGMARSFEVLGSVPQRRVVAASNVPARTAKAQVHPLNSELEALLAAFGAGVHLLNAREMRTGLHTDSPYFLAIQTRTRRQPQQPRPLHALPI